MIRRLDYRPHKNRLWDNSGGVEKLNLCGPACRWDYRASKADFGIQPTQTQPGYGAMRPGRGS